MSGQTVTIIGYIITGISAILLILSEFIFRKRKKTIAERVYERME